jgi:hypothetical protein
MSQVAVEKGRFVQFPVHLIYGCPGLTRDDKWVALAIMGECWTEGPYRLSYREIANLAKVPLSLLCTYTDKKGVQHEGIMDRIERVTGYMHVDLGKEITSGGKVRGNAQSFITIDYARIWKDNVDYCETKKQKAIQSVQDYKPVSHANRFTNEPVSNTNEPVSNTNEPVSNTNEPVSNTNEPVHVASSNDATYITKILKTKEDKEDSASQIIAPFVSPKNENVSQSTTKAIEVSLFPEETPLEVIPIAVEPSKKSPKVKRLPESCEFPALDAPWDTITCRQLFNSWRGIPLVSHSLDNQSGSYLSTHFNRETVVAVHDYMISDPWWSAHTDGDIGSVARNITKVMKQMSTNSSKGASSNILNFSSSTAVSRPKLEEFEASVIAGNPIFVELSLEERNHLKATSRKLYFGLLKDNQRAKNAAAYAANHQMATV